MRNRYDLALIHPPSIFDFRQRMLQYGPVSDVVPSSPVFDLYPIGFLSTLTYLTRKGFKVRIINLAANMLINPKLNVEKIVEELEAEIYGIDLHWLPHIQGAIGVAKIVKKLHPDKKVVFGGLTSTIFWREILKNYNYIDFVLLGDTTEKPMETLLESVIENRGLLDSVPNMARRGERGRIRRTDLTFVPESLDEFSIDYGTVIKESLSRKHLFLSIPFANFISEPIGASLSYKGCIHNCITCGGSQFTYSCFFNRDKLGVKSPNKIFEEVKSLSDYMKIPIFILGDLQLIGMKRIRTLTRMLNKERLDNPLLFEFFYPPPKSVLSLIRKAADRISIQLSPETQDENVRYAFGKKYDNEQLFAFICNLLEFDVDRLDLYFMIGLPKQDYSSAADIPKYIEQIIGRLNTNRFYKTGKINFFTAPLAPFLDPGSKVFTDPRTYGYTLLFESLEDHENIASSAGSWKASLNYETDWMSKDRIVKATYDVAEKVVKIKIKHDIVKEDEGLKTIELIKGTRRIIDSSRRPLRRLADKETVSKGDLYSTRRLLLTARPKLVSTLIKSVIRRR